MTGLVPARVGGPVKAGLLDLVDHATAAGFSTRWACRLLGVDHARLIGWTARSRAGDGLEDTSPGPAAGEALHALLDWEKSAVLTLAKDWGQVDLSHRKLAHRGSRLDMVYLSESSVLRVLTEAGMHLPGIPIVRDPRGKTPWPEWVELVPGQIFIYDFTHFTGLRGWCAIAVVDVISRYWLSTVLSPEETSTQVQSAFIAALEADGKSWLLDDADLDLAQQLACGLVPENDERVPLLLAVSDNGPQMTSSKTAQFMAIARIAQHFGRPGTPNDQAWIESFFGHLKTEHPYLNTITDPATLRAELDVRREHYNTVRLHEGIGYVTPDDEHHGRGPTIRKARQDGLTAARTHRIATRRKLRQTQHTNTSPNEDN
jgi:transposase InsO family protein